MPPVITNANNLRSWHTNQSPVNNQKTKDEKCERFVAKWTKSAPNIIANVRHTWLYECAVSVMWRKLKLNSDGGDCGSKKYKWGYGEVWRSLRSVEIWSLESGGRLCVGGFSRNVVLVAVNMLTLSLVFKKCYQCTFNSNCKYNAAVVILLFNTKMYIPVNFDGSWRLF
jgi:hypothetical protein